MGPRETQNTILLAKIIILLSRSISTNLGKRHFFRPLPAGLSATNCHLSGNSKNSRATPPGSTPACSSRDRPSPNPHPRPASQHDHHIPGQPKTEGTPLHQKADGTIVRARSPNRRRTQHIKKIRESVGGRGNRSRVIEGQFGAQLMHRGLWTSAITQPWHTNRFWHAKSLALIVPLSTIFKQYDYNPFQISWL